MSGIEAGSTPVRRRPRGDIRGLLFAAVLAGEQLVEQPTTPTDLMGSEMEQGPSVGLEVVAVPQPPAETIATPADS
jgi:hypothetical protein